MVMWDKDSCADAGFLKIDLLGLGMLSAVERCVSRSPPCAGNVSICPASRWTTRHLDAIQRGETTGVFQIESRAQMGSLLRTRPRTLDDITIQVAIVRPGPIVGGAVNPYIERLQRLRVDPDFPIPYDHPSLEPVLETLGTIIFQDQVIEVAMAFSGFSPGEAESLRRAMSRKRSQAAIDATASSSSAARLSAGMTSHRNWLSASGTWSRAFRLRLSQGAQCRLRSARLPIDVAARALRAGVPDRAAR